MVGGVVVVLCVVVCGCVCAVMFTFVLRVVGCVNLKCVVACVGVIWCWVGVIWFDVFLCLRVLCCVDVLL